MRIGYIRVSSTDQNEKRQLENVELDKIFIDHASGHTTERPQFKEMMAFIREGDFVVVHSMDRLARNLDDLRKIVKTLTEKKVAIQFLKEDLTFREGDSPMDNLLLSIFGAFFEFERSLIRERQREGIEVAKKSGAFKGRKKRFTKSQAIELQQRVKNGEKIAKLAIEFNVSRQAIYRYVNYYFKDKEG